MIHFTNKKTGEVFGYQSNDEAKKYNSDYKNLVQMSDEQLSGYKNKPLGGKWTINGWVIDDELLKHEQEQIIEQQKSKKETLLSDSVKEISLLQDAIDLDMAEDGDEEKLKAWKKYRVLLNRVDTSIIPCEFPAKPE